MSLATRCPACQTVFRVVQDQLRVSEGWVRCGRCAEVFNALEQMVEVVKPTVPDAMPSGMGSDRSEPAAPAVRSTEPPPIPPPPLPAGTPDLSDLAPSREETAIPPMSFAPLPDPAQALDLAPALPVGVVAAHEELYEAPRSAGADADEPARDRDPAVDVAPDMPPPSERAPVQATQHERDPLDVLPLRAMSDAEVPREPPATDTTAAQTTLPADSAFAATPAHADDPVAPLPGFLRRAEDAARWQRPAVRRTLAAVLVIGLASLVLQAMLAYRDLLAARWPETRTVLAPLCEALGCRIEQPRWIDAVVVDSTGLTKVDGSAYRLSVVMRNRSSMALALPAVDLMLTDTQGRLVARRTLTARELGATAAALPVQAELTLAATLQVTGATVAGYTIEVFYP